jgi:putative flippase GtrA
MERILQLSQKYQQLIVYGVIGMSGATLDFLAYLFLYQVVNIPPPIASFISVTLGITNNFILNSRFNFRVSNKLLQRFISFYSIGLVGALVSALLIALLQHFQIGPTAAKLITIPPIVLGQYIFNKRISFRS